MAKGTGEENEVFDDKAAKRAEKQKKKEAKKEQKRKKKNGDFPEDDSEKEEGGKFLVILVTILIVAIWIGILGLIIKLDVGGFGSTVLYPVLKDVPYVNRILPKSEEEDRRPNSDHSVDVQYPYTTLDEAVERIKELERELSDAQEDAKEGEATLEQLQAEVNRLKQFESQQAEFEERKTKFYEEVVFSDQAPDINEYRAYYESIDPANAAELYKQVVQKEAYSDEMKEYISTYSTMKANAAAEILQKMEDDMKLVAKILDGMDVDSRGKILGAMDAEFAAKLTKLMEPAAP